MDLQKLREQIDEVDSQLVELFQKRQQICRSVAEYKIETGKRVLDPEREKEKLAKAEAMVSDDFERQGVQDMFRQLMAVSRKLQYRILEERGQGLKLPFAQIDGLKKDARVVYQGVPGAYSEQDRKSTRLNSSH